MPALTEQEKNNSALILSSLLDHNYITASDRALQMAIIVDLTKIDEYVMFRLPDLAVVVKGKIMFPSCEELDKAILDYALISCLFSRDVPNT